MTKKEINNKAILHEFRRVSRLLNKWDEADLIQLDMESRYDGKIFLHSYELGISSDDYTEQEMFHILAGMRFALILERSK